MANFGFTTNSSPNYDPNAGALTGLGNLSPLLQLGGSIYSSQNAAQQQTEGSINAQNTQRQYLAQATQNAAPYTQAGGAALNALGSYYGLPGYGSFNPSVITNMPGYQFQLQQGDQAIQNSAAAKGLLNSGATVQSLENYNQGLAGQYANQYASQLAGLGGMGLAATNNLNSQIGRTAESIGGAQLYSGNAGAGMYQNLASGLGSGLAGLPQVFNGIGQIANAFGGGGSPNTYNYDTASYGNGFTPVGNGTSDYSPYVSAPDMGPPSNYVGLPTDTGGIPNWYDPGNFNAAGGEAAAGQIAGNPQSTNNAEFAAYSATNPDLGSSTQLPSGGSSLADLGRYAGEAGNALAVYQGLQRGGVSGYGSAAINAGSLANKAGAFGGAGSTAGGVLGAAGGALGIYNGIKQGGVLGGVNTALGAANLASGIGTLAGGTAAGGVGSLAAIGAYAGPIGVALAPILMGMSSPAYTLNGDYYNRMKGYLAAGPGAYAAQKGFNGLYWDPQYTNYESALQALGMAPTVTAGGGGGSGGGAKSSYV